MSDGYAGPSGDTGDVGTNNLEIERDCIDISSILSPAAPVLTK